MMIIRRWWLNSETWERGWLYLKPIIFKRIFFKANYLLLSRFSFHIFILLVTILAEKIYNLLYKFNDPSADPFFLPNSSSDHFIRWFCLMLSLSSFSFFLRSDIGGGSLSYHRYLLCMLANNACRHTLTEIC